MSPVPRGRLLDPSHGPACGERSETLLAHRNLVVEQILSGAGETPVDFVQDDDEWVALLAGAATLEIAGEPVQLRAGDWVFLPARTPHRLVRTAPGTSWLAVHLHGA